MGSVKGELEDLAFLHLEPEEHERVAREVARRMKVSEGMIADIRRRIEARLGEAGVAAEVSGRMKRYYSIWSKMKRTGVDVAQLYDILAFRIVVAETRDCYETLGIVHQLWRPVPGRIKDYIAMPKPNFYQSLHTTVIGETGQPFEIQIRTREMDLIAERGIAAHWKYKEGRLGPHADDARFQWLRQLVDWQSEVSDPRQFLSSLKVDLYPDEVYTFTPKGEVFAFPRGATPIDFAYRIHTDVGHRCVGARVNGKLVPLRTPLGSGDIVEILTAPNQTPSRDWLSFVVTSRARHKIRHFIHEQEKRQAVELGRRLLERELKKYKRTVRKLEAEGSLGRELQQWGFTRPDDLYAAIGYGKLAPKDALERFVPAEELARPEPEKKESAVSRVVRKILPFGVPDIVVVGHNDLLAVARQVLQPGAGREDRRLHHAGPGRLGPLGELPERAQPPLRSGAPDRRGLGRREEGLLRDRARGGHRRPAGPARGPDAGDRGRGLEHPEDRGAGGGDREGYVSVSLETSDLKHLEKILARLRAVAGVREVIRRYNVPKAGESEYAGSRRASSRARVEGARTPFRSRRRGRVPRRWLLGTTGLMRPVACAGSP